MTKQYTLIYILLGVLMFAVSAFTAAALREANTTYDLSALKTAQEQLATQVANQIAAQESAMAAWAAEATTEVETASEHIDLLRNSTCSSITQAAVGGGTGTLDAAAIDVCMDGGPMCNLSIIDFHECAAYCYPGPVYGYGSITGCCCQPLN